MECFYRSKPFDEEGKPIRGHRKKMFREWKERGMFESTEQRVHDQLRAIRKNGWLSELELETIKRQVEDQSQAELYREQDVTVDAETVETNVGTAKEETNDAGDSTSDTEGDLSEVHRRIVKQLKKIMVEGRTGDGTMFKKMFWRFKQIESTKWSII